MGARTVKFTNGLHVHHEISLAIPEATIHISRVFMGSFPVTPVLRRFLPTLAASVSVAASFFRPAAIDQYIALSIRQNGILRSNMKL
jgi:hypothetical protein